MKIYDYNNANDKIELEKHFEHHFENGTFVPFIGSGFTRGKPSKNGHVPSVSDLKNYMIDTIASIKGYSSDEKTELSQDSFSKLGDSFWKAFQNDPSNQQIKRFNEYVKNSFTGVRDLTYEQKLFLKSGWHYLYTINYDDAIERACQDFTVISPYRKVNTHHSSKEKRLYKIHGCASEFQKTGDSKMLIIGVKQYLDSMKNPDNAELFQNILADFSANNLIFVGCSLLDELDFLLASDTRLVENKQSNVDTHSYYVNLTNEGSKMSAKMIDDYENLGITDIINVTEPQLGDLYNFISNISKKALSIKNQSQLSFFTGYKFVQLPVNEKAENIGFLFETHRILPDIDKKITIPSFFTRRDETTRIIQNIEKNHGHIHIVRGSNFSGKTYILIDLLKQFGSKEVYFFKSGLPISEELLNILFEKKNAIIIFDEHTLSYDQLFVKLQRSIDKLEKNNTKVVAAINRDLSVFTQYYHDNSEFMKGRLYIYHLPPQMRKESKSVFFETFTREVGKAGLPVPDKHFSFLDYILSTEKVAMSQYFYQIPSINIIQGEDSANILKALILFANQETISVKRASTFCISNTLNDLTKSTEIDRMIQKDYLCEIVRSDATHDSYQFIMNSKFWIYKCLNTFAKNEKNYDLIAASYYGIVLDFTNNCVNNRKNYYGEIQPYYFLDTIQFVFFNLPGSNRSLDLAEKIYERLLPLLSNNYQFLHQKSKCLLWHAQFELDKEKKREILTSASLQIERAYQLAHENATKNAHYTLLHMKVTQSLIKVNCWKIDVGMQSSEMYFDILDTLNETLDGLIQLQHPEQSERLKKDELHDLSAFIERDVVAFNYVNSQQKRLGESIINKWRKYKI